MTCALKALDTPIHIKFEAKGDHSDGRPLDSPSHLFLTVRGPRHSALLMLLFLLLLLLLL